MSIFATKPIERIKEEQLGGQRPDEAGGLRRVLGPGQLVMLGVGAIIGTGIFVLTGQAAAANAGPAIVISMVLAGLTSVLAALCYSEFAASVPVAGSAYTYAYATMGEFVAWVIGWDLILEYALGAATVAVGWSGILVTLLAQLGLTFPAALSAAPGTVVPVAGGDPVTAVLNLPAILVTVAVTALLIFGVSESASVNSVIVVIKVAVLLIVIAAGALFVAAANWHPFIPPNTGTFGEYGWSGILRGAGVIFFAYIGFDAVSTSAQEARNPQRDMPRGILGSLAICTVLFVLVSGVMVGLVPYRTMLNQPAPLVMAIQAAADRATGTSWEGTMAVVSVLVTVGGLAGLSSVMVVMMLAAADFSLDVARRPAAGMGGPHPPQLSHAARLDARHGGRRRDRRRPHADRDARFARQHRDADGVRHRLDRDRRAAPHASRSAASFPNAVGAGAAGPVSGREPRADARAPARDVGAVGDMDGDRTGDLRRLRVPQEPAERERYLTTSSPSIFRHRSSCVRLQ
jgi:amino acid transporter